MLALAIVFLAANRGRRLASAAESSPWLPTAADQRGAVQHEISLPLRGLTPGGIYSISFSLSSPNEFVSQNSAGPGSEPKLVVAIRQGSRDLAFKILHLGDPDLYALVRLDSGDAEVRLTPANPPPAGFHYHLLVNHWAESARLAAEPNNSWQQANPIELGTTVFGSGDLSPYIPPDPHSEGAPPQTNDDWFCFDFRETNPKLVFFTLDLMERDNIPVDVAVFRVENGKPVAYERGADPVTPPHEVQALPGNKFTTRVLNEAGRYYIRVQARHPFYKLRTAVYDVPPYRDPRQAVQTAVDYIIRAGDSWHANTPRKGGVYDRVANVHQETSLCVACHPTHFSQRAQLYALRNGYAVTGRQQLQFLAERFYNNPRPFYGYEAQGASWARVISAPANVLGRMAALLNIYEKEVTGEHREKFFRGISEYLKLYYKDRDTLPPDESNGNTPLVSTYEVAWYAWVAAPELRPRLEQLIAQGTFENGQIKNVCDLCYQTLALAEINREKYAGKIRRNAERLLALQRPSGQWALDFQPEAPEAEFQTGHALWALAAAGYPADHPQIAKGLQYLLNRQQQFGGWFDPLQSYENFRTPFRETQMAVLALSAFYKGPAPAGGKAGDSGNARAAMARKRTSPTLPPDHAGAALEWMDSIWRLPSDTDLQRVERAARSNDALVRQQAAECLGRLAYAPAVPLLGSLLGDESKMVQRTAAWALRQIISRRREGAREVEEALSARNERIRWGATRVFATHFSYVVDQVHPDPLLALLYDPSPVIRMQAIKGLWQWWFWDARGESRSRIEDAILSAMAEPQHPWVERNLREAAYNIADENVRYLYNNWVALLPKNALRDRAVRGRLAVEQELAEKFARVLETGGDRQKKILLAGLGQFPLRRADSYPLNAQLVRKEEGLKYTRIGNDIEQILFLGRSADRMAQVLLPLIQSSDPEMRREATLAAYMVREIRTKQSYGGSRRYGWDDVVRLAGFHEENRRKLALAVIERLEDPDSSVRAIARDIYSDFTQDFDGPGRSRVEQVLLRLLESSNPESRAAALWIIHDAPAFPPDSPILPLVRQAVLAGKQGVAAVAALQACPSLFGDPQIVEAVRRAIESENPAMQRAGLELILRNQPKMQDPVLAAAFQKAVAATDSSRKRLLLDIIDAHREIAETEAGAGIVNLALRSGETSLAAAAVNLVKEERRLFRRRDTQTLLERAIDDGKLSSTLRTSIAELLGKTAASNSIPAAAPKTAVNLDYPYFRERVEPLLEARGPDGNACVDCHSTHTLFHLNRPRPGAPGEAQVRQNYESALKVAAPGEPESSLILRKPTSDAAVEGVLGGGLSHGGGIRWPAGSWQYDTILNWIKGARSDQKSAKLSN
jgi:HEAT repeat protein